MSGEPPGTDPRTLKELGRFDRSFFIRMTGSFLVLLFVVAALELGLRFGLELYRFHRDGPAATEQAARQLEADIRSIMINEGGPVASRTVYPILDRTFERAGLEIAVEPSPATVESIRQVFAFRPRGLPAVFPEGTHHEARRELRAESFCLQCHVTASEGDVLGTVVVRDYLAASLGGWWREVRLTATVNLAKIVIHILILFFLLRALMEPLLSLRGAVARLADGTGGVHTRADVRSSDEFGELAHDLNTFLDRVTEILSDLRALLSRLVAVGQRLTSVTGTADVQLASLEQTLHATLPREDDDEDAIGRRLRNLPRLVHGVHELRHTVQQMDFLDDQLNDVVGTGDVLLDRLMDHDGPDDGLDDG